MPIEPTSVSKPAVREVESTSANFGSWTSMQGSSTGGKDRPLNSLWEKAINGAQKLFGSEKSGSASLEEKGEKEERHDSANASDHGSEHSFNARTSFVGRRFGSFGGAAFGGNTFGSVATSRAAPDTSFNEFEPRAVVESPKAKPDNELAAKERPVEQPNSSAQEASQKAKRVAEESAEDEAAKEKRAELGPVKPVQKSAATQPLVAAAPVQTPVSQVQAAANAAQQEQVASAVQPQAVAAAATQAQANSQAPVENAQASQQATVQSAVTQPKAGIANANTPVASEAAKPQLPAQAATQAQNALANNPAAQKPIDAKVEVPTVASQESKPQQAANLENTKHQVPSAEGLAKTGAPANEAPAQPAAKPQAEGAQTKESSTLASPVKDLGGAKETLGFDLAKAKEAVSEALAKGAASKPTPQSAQAPVTAQPAPQQTQAPVADAAAKPALGELGTARAAEASASDGKELSNADASKRELSALAQQRGSNARASHEGAAQVRATGQEATGFDPKMSQATGAASVSANQFARETAAAAASRTQVSGPQGKGNGPATQGTNPTGVNGVASGTQAQGLGTASQGAQQGQSKNSDGDPAAKQDFGSAMKQASTSKGSEKPLDGGQSFDAKVEAAENRRSEAASKARQTSYVSKTAAEVKEVIATLTKSIDRLVTDKSGAMNLKLNFEGGGSMKLSISMEGGKVTTSMQTDVAGLEGAIKANWGELANDWNQKGVKLATPHFQNSESGKESSNFENFGEFSSKQNRQADGRQGEDRGRGTGQESGPRGFSSGSSDEPDTRGLANQSREEVISDKELKTYA